MNLKISVYFWTQPHASPLQAMRFGDLPKWAVELSNSIREVVLFNSYVQEPQGLANCGNDQEANFFPPDLLWREPLFDQLIANVYQPGEVRLTFETYVGYSIKLFSRLVV